MKDINTYTVDTYLVGKKCTGSQIHIESQMRKMSIERLTTIKCKKAKKKENKQSIE